MTAITITEAQVMAMWDANLSIEQIAWRLGHQNRKRICKIVGRLHVGDEDRASVRDVIASTRRFEAALIASGGRFA